MMLDSWNSLCTMSTDWPSSKRTWLTCLKLEKACPLDYVAAHTWYSAAAAGGERHSSARLKSLAGVMLPAQLTLAKTQAVVCLAKHEKPAGTAEIQGAGGMSFLPEK